MQRMLREEDVHGSVERLLAPVQPHLAVARQRAHVLVVPSNCRGQSPKHNGRVVGVDGDVDVGGSPRVVDMERQRDGSAEGVPNSMAVEAIVNGYEATKDEARGHEVSFIE